MKLCSQCHTGPRLPRQRYCAACHARAQIGYRQRRRDRLAALVAAASACPHPACQAAAAAFSRGTKGQA